MKKRILSVLLTLCMVLAVMPMTAYAEDCNHDWGDWTSNGDGTHTRICKNDSSHTETEDCKAHWSVTCLQDGKCETCSGQCKGDHEFLSAWASGEETHFHTCLYCGIHKDEAAHYDDNNDHRCDLVGCGKYIGPHDDENRDHKCDVCGWEVSDCTFSEWTETGTDGEYERECSYCHRKETASIWVIELKAGETYTVDTEMTQALNEIIRFSDKYKFEYVSENETRLKTVSGKLLFTAKRVNNELKVIVDNGVTSEDGYTLTLDEPEARSDGTIFFAVEYRFIPKQYTVTFDVDGGSTISAQMVNHGEKAQAPTVPTKTGYVFDGWLLGEDEYSFNTPVTENITLTARWTLCDHKDSIAKPTCTEPATCTVCGGTISATGHDYESTVTTEATCTEEGVRTYICKNDNTHSYTEPISAKGHDLVHHEAQAASCTVIGWEEYDTCNNCDYSTYAEIVATGHSFGDWETVTSPNCTDKGSEKRTCPACQTVETRDLSPNGHSWESDYTIDKQATCEADGSKSIHCSKCDAVKDSETISATGHNYESSVTTAATCTEKGVRTYVCKNDSTHTYTEPISANGHDLVHHEAQAATAAELGNTEYWYCDDCDKYFSDEAGTKEIKQADTVVAKLAPSITAGNNATVTQGDNKALSFTSDAAFEDFIRVELDGKTLDEKNYTVKAGSTIVTLNADYVATLFASEHTLGIVSQSGTATAKFTVNAKAADTNSSDKSLQTGDNSHMMLWLALLFISGAGIVGTTVTSKKKKYNR